MLFVWAIRSFRGLRNLLIAAGSIFFLFLCLDLAFPLPEYHLKKDYSTVYLDRNGELLRISLSDSEKFRIKLPLNQVSPYMQRGILEYEDRYFFYHPGINPVSVIRALFLNLSHGKIVSGASTITMQIARLMEPKPRTLTSKLIEVFRALQLESSFDKDEILELYLNSIPMGGNLEGVGAGALYYFGKNARDLSLYEASVLIGLPNSPNRNRPDRHPKNATKQMARVLSRIYPGLGITEKDYLKTLNRKVSVTPHRFPFRCPHLIESGPSIHSKFFTQYSIGLELQTYCEMVLSDYHRKLNFQGIYNGAIIVADNHTGQILAYVGSPDYFDNSHCGQINGCSIPRSPGSTLKPFLYARGIESGLITPGKTVYDVPILDHSYSPVNYSKTSNGPVPAKFALIHSLNIPAVRLERTLDDRGLKGLLKKIFPGKEDILIEKSGLSLVLGGFGISLENMVRLYMMLASNGNYKPLHFFLNSHEKLIADRQLIDPRACYLVTDMLSDCHRPDMPHSWEFTLDLAKISLKTGTSFGLRDAWCIGYNPDYTVGVWQGNADNKGSTSLIGVRRAAPLMIKIFDHITRKSDSWFSRPEGIAVRKVCPVSGEKAGPFCGKQLKNDFFIPGISSERKCQVHKKITIRKKTGMQVCSRCMTGPKSDYKSKIVESWPGEIASFLRTRGHRYSAMPGHNPECTYYTQKQKPRIISPSDLSEYELVEHLPQDSQKIPLRAFVSQDSGEEVYWFAGKKLLYRGSADKTYFFAPDKGKCIISVVDSRGRSDSVTIRVY